MVRNGILRKLLAALFCGFLVLFGASAAYAGGNGSGNGSGNGGGNGSGNGSGNGHDDDDDDVGGTDEEDDVDDSLARTGDDLVFPLTIGGGLVATALATRRFLGSRT